MLCNKHRHKDGGKNQVFRRTEQGVNTEHVENKEVKIKRQGKKLNMIYMYIFT